MIQLNQTTAAFTVAFSISIGISTTWAQAAPADVPVGEIVDVTNPSASGVSIKRPNGETETAQPYQLVYGGDTINVRSGTATLEMAKNDGGTVAITSANSPFRVNSHTVSQSDVSAFGSLYRKFSFVFSPPHDMTVVMTTPRSIDATGPLAPSPYLAAVPQQVRASYDQTLVVAWNGDAADVSLQDAAGSELVSVKATDTNTGPGYAYVHCKPLSMGQYALTIKAASARMIIPMIVVNSIPTPSGSYTEQAANAAHRLQDDPSQQLQALADLQRISDDDFAALSIIQSVRQGRTR